MMIMKLQLTFSLRPWCSLVLRHCDKTNIGPGVDLTTTTTALSSRPRTTLTHNLPLNTRYPLILIHNQLASGLQQIVHSKVSSFGGCYKSMQKV